MAIRLQFVNLVIPVATLERALAGQGGFRKFIESQGPLLNEMVWSDAYLCCVDGAMDWSLTEDMVARWEAHGLQGLVGVAPHQWWKDLAICASGRGATFPCDWLQYDAKENCVYLNGTPKVEVIGPSPLS